ncbi:MAG: hypothetical protein HZA91_11600 [Verrucomicrobia bacterium]|nr:hypothetical protein [Verrucomicrobiota bacterium]
MKRKPGRPKVPTSQQRNIVFPVRLSGDESKAVHQAAEDASERPATWARKQLLKAAGVE